MTEFDPDLLSELNTEDLACLGLRRVEWSVVDLIRGMRELAADHFAIARYCPSEAEAGEEYLARAAALEAANTADQSPIDSEVPTPPMIKRRHPRSLESTLNGAKALPAMKQTIPLTAPADPIELERW